MSKHGMAKTDKKLVLSLSSVRLLAALRAESQGADAPGGFPCASNQSGQKGGCLLPPK